MKPRRQSWILCILVLFCATLCRSQTKKSPDGPLSRYLVDENHKAAASDVFKILKQAKSKIFEGTEGNSQLLRDKSSHTYGLGGTYEFLLNAVSKTDNSKKFGVNSDHWPAGSLYEHAQDETISKISEYAKAALTLPEDIHAKFLSTGGTPTKTLMDFKEDDLKKIWIDTNKEHMTRSNHFNSHVGKLFKAGKFFEAIFVSIEGYEVGLKEIFRNQYLEAELTRKYETEFQLSFRNIDEDILKKYHELESDAIKTSVENVENEKKYANLPEGKRVEVARQEARKLLKYKIIEDSKRASNELLIFNAKYSVAMGMAEVEFSQDKYSKWSKQDKQMAGDEFMSKILFADTMRGTEKISDELLTRSDLMASNEFDKYKPGIAEGLEVHKKNGLITDSESTALKEMFNLQENPASKFELTSIRENLINLRTEYYNLVNNLETCDIGGRKRRAATSCDSYKRKRWQNLENPAVTKSRFSNIIGFSQPIDDASFILKKIQDGEVESLLRDENRNIDFKKVQIGGETLRDSLTRVSSPSTTIKNLKNIASTTLSRGNHLVGKLNKAFAYKNIAEGLAKGDYESVAITAGLLGLSKGSQILEASSHKSVRNLGKMFDKAGDAIGLYFDMKTLFASADCLSEKQENDNNCMNPITKGMCIPPSEICEGRDATLFVIQSSFDVTFGYVNLICRPCQTFTAIPQMVLSFSFNVAQADKILDAFEHTIPLSSSERTREWFRLVVGLGISVDLVHTKDMKIINSARAADMLGFLKDNHEAITGLVVPLNIKKSCSSGGIFFVIGFYSQTSCKWVEFPSTTVILNHQFINMIGDYFLPRWLPSVPQADLFCKPFMSKEYDMNTAVKYNSTADNFCFGMFGIEYKPKGRKATLFDYRLENQKTEDVPKRIDNAYGYKSSENIFIFGNGNRPTTVKFYGGDKDDVYQIVGDMSTGILNGHGGSDLLDVSGVGNNATIDFQNDTMHTAKVIKIKNIEKVIGSEYWQENVTCSCTTEYVSMGGSPWQTGPDVITISERDCLHKLMLHLKKNSIVYCHPFMRGTFAYNITSEGGTIINIKSKEKDAVHMILIPHTYLEIMMEMKGDIIFTSTNMNLTLLELQLNGKDTTYSGYNLQIFTEGKYGSPPATIFLESIKSLAFHLGKSGESLYKRIQASSQFRMLVYTYENQSELEITGECVEVHENWLIPVNLKLPSKFKLNCGKTAVWMVDLSMQKVSNFTIDSGKLSGDSKIFVETEGELGLIGSSQTPQTYLVRCGSLILNSGGGNLTASDRIIVNKSDECEQPLFATFILKNHVTIDNHEKSPDSEFRYILNKGTSINGISVKISNGSNSRHIFTLGFISDKLTNVLWHESSQTLEIKLGSIGSLEISGFSTYSTLTMVDDVQLVVKEGQPALLYSNIGNKKIKCIPSLNNIFVISNTSEETEKIVACSRNDTFLLIDPPQYNSLALISGGTLDLSQSSSSHTQIEIIAGIGVTYFGPDSEFDIVFDNLEQIAGSEEDAETVNVTGQMSPIYLNLRGGGDSISITDSAPVVTVSLHSNSTVLISNTSVNFEISALPFLIEKEEEDMFDFYINCCDESACIEHLHNIKLNKVSMRDIQFLYRYENTIEVTLNSKMFSFHLVNGGTNCVKNVNISLSSLSLETEDGYIIMQNRLGTSQIVKNIPLEECEITETFDENAEHSLKMGGILMIPCLGGEHEIQKVLIFGGDESINYLESLDGITTHLIASNEYAAQNVFIVPKSSQITYIYSKEMKDDGENILDLSEFYDPDLNPCAALELPVISFHGENIAIEVKNSASKIIVVDGPKLIEQVQVAIWNCRYNISKTDEETGWGLIRRDFEIQAGKKIIVLTGSDLDDRNVVLMPMREEEVTLYKSGSKDVIVTDVLNGGDFTLLIEGKGEVENSTEILFSLRMSSGEVVGILGNEITALPDIGEAMTAVYIKMGIISLVVIVLGVALGALISCAVIKKVRGLRGERVVKDERNLRHIYTAVDYGVK